MGIWGKAAVGILAENRDKWYLCWECYQLCLENPPFEYFYRTKADAGLLCCLAIASAVIVISSSFAIGILLIHIVDLSCGLLKRGMEEGAPQSMEPMVLERLVMPESEYPPIGLTPDPPIRPADSRDLIFNFLVDLNQPPPKDVWEAVRMTEQALEMSGNGYIDRVQALDMSAEQCMVLHAIMTQVLTNRDHLDKDGNITAWWKSMATRYARFKKFNDYLAPFREELLVLGQQSSVSSDLFS
jgi:hypothetical protein